MVLVVVGGFGWKAGGVWVVSIICCIDVTFSSCVFGV